MTKMNQMTIGIIGNGFVGHATTTLACDSVKTIVYDKDPSKCYPSDMKFEDLKNCDLIFISVPTPMFTTGKCNLNIIDSVITDLTKLNYPMKNVIIRSTVPPGTSDKYNCSFMPEFLTEQNYLRDFKNNNCWILGTTCKYVEQTFTKVINFAHKEGRITSNNTYVVKPVEAEIIKYGRNNFMAVKVAFFNEYSNVTNEHGCDFEKVRNGICMDHRITHSHSYVPGPDGRKGFGGTCFPKDINAMIYHMENDLELKSYVLTNSYKRNIEVDRVEKDWQKDSRAYTK